MERQRTDPWYCWPLAKMSSSSSEHEVQQEFQAPKEVPPSSRPFIVDNATRSMSIDSRDDQMGQRDHGSMRGMPPSPRSPHVMVARPPPMYPHRYATGRTMPSRHVQSVVTSSFSMEDDRDDMHHVFRHGEPMHPMESEEGEREGWGPPRGSEGMYPSVQPPHGATPMDGNPLIKRAFSSSGYFVPTDTMKRSYYHHSSVPSNQYPPTQLPPDFMPPTKRTRMEPRRKEIVIPTHDDHYQVPRPHSFPTPPPQPWTPPRGSMGQHPPPHPRSPMPYHSTGGYSRSPRAYHQISPASEHEDSPRSWAGPSSGQPWAPTPRRHSTHFWESPRGRDLNDGFREPYSRQHSYSQEEAMMQSRGEDGKMGVAPDAPMPPGSEMKKPGSFMLLALPQDRVSLSETLCVVRENIEVFTATQADVDAPAPGRKHAVVVGQVGLRCIHCRHTTKCSDRVKRAVCYPSSIKRIYRTVIDMKLDHFSQCKFVPVALKNRLDELKAVHSRSTGTTMQYFIHAAHCLGMEDSSNGVQLRESVVGRGEPQAVTPRSDGRHHPNPRDAGGSTAIVTRCDSMSSGSWMSGSAMDFASPPRIDTMSSGSFEAAGSAASEGQVSASASKWFQGCVPLALAEDASALSPLRCFLREQVCAFSATENDIAVRAPTTFSISVGQVGIGCIHCIRESSKLRSNRAVCFPFSIGRIYQSVADIQRFHFGECKNMPQDVKEKFLKLQSASSKGSKGLATRQYWVTSAKKIGLVDTTQGIRFGRDPTKPEASGSFSLDILAQVAFSVTTASKRLVLPEDKPCIAEFLYVVMDQLQPCRFTEADRNKRRLKDVGCIGVECKHCAGKVDSRKFFWSSVSAVESNFVSVHTHMFECKSVPQALKDQLTELKKLRKEQTAALKSGSQKAFFARVWKRLHDDEEKQNEKRQTMQCLPSPQVPTPPAEQQQQPDQPLQGDNTAAAQIATSETAVPGVEIENETKQEEKNSSDAPSQIETTTDIISI